MGIRLTVVTVIFSLLYSMLVFRLLTVQIEERQRYEAEASSYHLLNGLLAPVRGSIYFTDKEGKAVPAAINREYATIYAKPNKVADPVWAAELLSEISSIDRSRLLSILSRKEDPYEPIIKKASSQQVAMVQKTDFGCSDKKPGCVGVEKNRSRFYPLGSLAAHLLGFVSADERVGGAYGVELYYEKKLKGSPGMVDGDRIIQAALPGEDVRLTIDLNIQKEAERILNELVKKYRAVRGTVIVQDPKTGKILAMGSTPNFDPNFYGQYEVATFLNPAVQSVYEPGSIFKVITMAAALDAGKITPETTYFDTGSLTLNGQTIKNWDLKARGKVTMTEVIENSINTGAAFAERSLGHDLFYDYLVKFGFKEKTNIDLPGEVVGSLKPLETDRRDINFATASFGQGISVTPLALIRAVSAIANGGVMMKPYLNADDQPTVVRRVIKAEASRQAVAMMVSGVDRSGVAKIRGYTVAGKTGTAQVPDFKKGGYTDEVINTYVGFAPAYDPKFVILLKIDKPVGAPLAGLTVVPAFRELAEFILNYYHIPPDRLTDNQ